ncbi:hypothetical protein GLE_4386 [Lysobacter enzymogenes]|uniref:Uncharacterized protein n=1 Tax=Lysobacter enzymogenes TaxID=69 RepID=A0A0S2DN57_LYSEN|nr:hypothetical protein GLE_4386 [Lysobacter enzymogenes]
MGGPSGPTLSDPTQRSDLSRKHRGSSPSHQSEPSHGMLLWEGLQARCLSIPRDEAT